MIQTLSKTLALLSVLTLLTFAVGVHAQTTNDATYDASGTPNTGTTDVNTTDTTNPGLPNTGVGGDAAIALTAVLAAMAAGAAGVYTLARRNAF